MEKQIALPKTMLAIIEVQLECIEVLKKEIRFLKQELTYSIKNVERLENQSNIWREIAHNSYHAYNDQVDREANP